MPPQRVAPSLEGDAGPPFLLTNAGSTSTTSFLPTTTVGIGSSYGPMKSRFLLPDDCWTPKNSDITSIVSSFTTTTYVYVPVGCDIDRKSCCPDGYNYTAVRDSDLKYWSPGICPSKFGIASEVLTTYTDATTTGISTIQAWGNPQALAAGNGPGAALNEGGAILVPRQSAATATSTEPFYYNSGQCCPSSWELSTSTMTVLGNLGLYCLKPGEPLPMTSTGDPYHTTITITVATALSVRWNNSRDVFLTAPTTTTTILVSPTETSEHHNNHGLNTGAAAGVAIGVLCLSAILGFLVFYKVWHKHHKSLPGFGSSRRWGDSFKFATKFRGIWPRKDAPELPPASTVKNYAATDPFSPGEEKSEHVTAHEAVHAGMASPVSIESEWNAKTNVGAASQEHQEMNRTDFDIHAPGSMPYAETSGTPGR